MSISIQNTRIDFLLLVLLVLFRNSESFVVIKAFIRRFACAINYVRKHCHEVTLRPRKAKQSERKGKLTERSKVVKEVVREVCARFSKKKHQLAVGHESHDCRQRFFDRWVDRNTSSTRSWKDIGSNTRHRESIWLRMSQ